MKKTFTVSLCALCWLLVASASLEAKIAVKIQVLKEISCQGASDGKIMVTKSGGGCYPAIVEIHSGLAAGTYSFTHTSCVNPSKSITKSVTLVDGQPLPVEINEIMPPSCKGEMDGILKVKASGPGPFTFSWNDQGSGELRTGLKAGNYSVTATSNAKGCTGMATITIEDGPPMVIDLVSQKSPDCLGGNNGKIRVAINENCEPATLSWSDGGTGKSRTGLKAGNYSVTATNPTTGTTATTPVTLPEGPPCNGPTCPPPTNIVVSNITAASAQISWFGLGDYVIQYRPSSQTNWISLPEQIGSPLGTIVLDNLTPGTTYLVRIRTLCTLTNSIKYPSAWVVVSFATAGGFQKAAFRFFEAHVYPNPSASGIFTLELPEGGAKNLEVFDALGRCVQNFQPDSEALEIDLSRSPAGIYLLRATLADGSQTSAKLLRN